MGMKTHNKCNIIVFREKINESKTRRDLSVFVCSKHK